MRGPGTERAGAGQDVPRPPPRAQHHGAGTEPPAGLGRARGRAAQQQQVPQRDQVVLGVSGGLPAWHSVPRCLLCFPRRRPGRAVLLTAASSPGDPRGYLWHRAVLGTARFLPARCRVPLLAVGPSGAVGLPCSAQPPLGAGRLVGALRGCRDRAGVSTGLLGAATPCATPGMTVGSPVTPLTHAIPGDDTGDGNGVTGCPVYVLGTTPGTTLGSPAALAPCAHPGSDAGGDSRVTHHPMPTLGTTAGSPAIPCPSWGRQWGCSHPGAPCRPWG